MNDDLVDELAPSRDESRELATQRVEVGTLLQHALEIRLEQLLLLLCRAERLLALIVAGDHRIIPAGLSACDQPSGVPRPAPGQRHTCAVARPAR